MKLDLEERDQQVEEENLEESVEEKQIEDNWDTSSLLKKRNTISVNTSASTAIRYEALSCTDAALATAYLGDLIKASILPPEAASLAVDGAKVQRAKDRMMERATEFGEQQIKSNDIQCIMFDARINKKTKVMYHDEETGKFFLGWNQKNIIQ